MAIFMNFHASSIDILFMPCTYYERKSCCNKTQTKENGANHIAKHDGQVSSEPVVARRVVPFGAVLPWFLCRATSMHN